VTGVQTCALPISWSSANYWALSSRDKFTGLQSLYSTTVDHFIDISTSESTDAFSYYGASSVHYLFANTRALSAAVSYNVQPLSTVADDQDMNFSGSCKFGDTKSSSGCKWHSATPSEASAGEMPRSSISLHHVQTATMTAGKP